MRCYKIVDNGYLVAVGRGPGGTEITAEEYASFMEIIRSRPTPPEGFDYRLNEDLIWELLEPLPVEPVEPVDAEATEADYISALADLGVTL